MSSDAVRAIAEAVLYEGYALWPYRRSALKNQQRFTFGGVYPQAFAQLGGDRSEIRMECLLELGQEPVVELTLRWLHLAQRQPLFHGQAVDELEVGGERYMAWEEATERELGTGELALGRLGDGLALTVEVPAEEDLEQLDGQSSLRRSWDRLEGTLTLSASKAAAGVARLSARFCNRSQWRGSDRSQALGRSFLSAHLVAHCRGGAFVSCTDPPGELAAAANACRNEGVWPVLVGDEGQRDTVLGSPIILLDYPGIAPESPGNLFDGGEIDALLIHSIRGLTEAEHEEMRASDPRTREILDRSLGLSPEQMLSLYGAVREMRRVES